MDITKGFKAFKKGLICAPDENHIKQYAENTIFEENGEDICCPGMMHYCLSPLDCLQHYPLIDEKGDLVEIAEVEALDAPITDDGTKYATTKLKIGTRLNLKEIVTVGVRFILDNVDEIDNSDNSQLAASGNNSRLAASGYNSRLAASGNSSQLAASGDNSQLAASGKNSVVAAIGANSKIKAAIGCWITLAEYKRDGDGRYKPVCVKSAQIDGERLKADTWYMLQNGEFVEVTEA